MKKNIGTCINTRVILLEYYKTLIFDCFCFRFYAISCQLSPVLHSSGIQLIETDTFKLHCNQTQTGYKLLVLTVISYTGSGNMFCYKIKATTVFTMTDTLSYELLRQYYN